jgi:cytochrome c oxidase assembly protein subunit 15
MMLFRPEQHDVDKEGAERMRQGLKWLSTVMAFGMLLVLLGGAIVTKTESGEGCGDSWPFCEGGMLGGWLPQPNFASFVEYGHRLVSGIEGLLVLATLIGVMLYLRQHRLILILVISTFFFTVLQAILGAFAVIWPTSSAVMALHFGFSLIAFASAFLLTLYIWRLSPAASTNAIASQSEPLQPMVSRSYRNEIWALTVYTYIVVYLGAFVRHTGSSGGCTGWPLCNGEWIPELSGAAGIAFLHRVGALMLLIWIVYQFLITRRHYREVRDVYLAMNAVMILAITQILTGAVIVFTITTGFYIFASLIHTLSIAGLFGVLCYLCIRSRQLS